MKKTLKFVGILLFLASCKTEIEQRIVGKWQAAQLMECDNLVPIETQLVDIEFLSNGNYVFHSTLNVKEEGSYRIKKNYLFTQDKLRDNAAEKAVLIKSITADSMLLQMSYKGKDQYLTLVKEGIKKKEESQEPQNADAKAVALATTTTATTTAMLSNNSSDSIQKAEEAKKIEEEKKKQAEEEAADKKREEAKSKSKKSESSSSSASEAYKKREAKRKAEERKAKEEAEKKAEKFRREYAKREAEKKKKKS